jgi:excisionase family DNA binding protein
MYQESPLDEQLVDHPRLLTVKEAAERMRVSTSALYDAIARGEIAAIRVGRAIRLHPDVLLGQDGFNG